MSHHHKLSLWSAIFINVNIMFGTGIFINTVNLAKLTGFLGFLTYALVALLILPLILSIAALLRRHPSGGFYVYAAQDINPFAGFLSAWAYFTGKLASATLLIHVFSSLVCSIIPICTGINPLFIDMVILAIFTWLNMLNIKTGSNIIYTFIALKLTPILFAIISCLYLYNYWSIPSESLLWSGIPAAIPLVLYAFTGFEASCSLSRSIKDAHVNGPKAVMYSYGLVVCITILYQLLFFTALGSSLMNLSSYLEAFPTLLQNLLPNIPYLAQHIVMLLHIALASSSLGGSYGILFSNHWNLYALAQHKHTFFQSLLTKFNKHQIPYACVVVEIILCIIYFLTTGGSPVPLQQISVLGCVIAYLLSIVGMLIVSYKGIDIYIQRCLVWLATGSCLLLVGMCIRNFTLYGISSLILFSLLLATGLCMYAITAMQQKKVKI